MTNLEIENEVGKLIEVLSTGQDPLDIATATLTKLWGGDPEAFLVWISTFVSRKGPDRFPAFNARVVKTAAYKAMNVLWQLSKDPTVPPTSTEPIVNVKVNRELSVSILHLTPDNRASLVRDGVLARAQKAMTCGEQEFEVGSAVLWAHGHDSGVWHMEPDKHDRELARMLGLPDLKAIFHLAKTLDCRTVGFYVKGQLTPGLPTWLPEPGGSWLP